MLKSAGIQRRPCSPLKVNRRFGGTSRLHLQARKISQARNQRGSKRQAGEWRTVITYNSGRQPMVRGPLMIGEKILVVRGEMWTLFAIFMFIVLFHYILIRLRVTDTGSLTIFALLRCRKSTLHERESINLFQTSSNKYHTNNFVTIKQVHFILIKWNFYDHVSGPRDSKLWV
jgi:hypothetical protein